MIYQIQVDCAQCSNPNQQRVERSRTQECRVISFRSHLPKTATGAMDRNLPYPRSRPYHKYLPDRKNDSFVNELLGFNERATGCGVPKFRHFDRTRSAIRVAGRHLSGLNRTEVGFDYVHQV
jgi:hypothetical protein